MQPGSATRFLLLLTDWASTASRAFLPWEEVYSIEDDLTGKHITRSLKGPETRNCVRAMINQILHYIFLHSTLNDCAIENPSIRYLHGISLMVMRSAFLIQSLLKICFSRVSKHRGDKAQGLCKTLFENLKSWTDILTLSQGEFSVRFYFEGYAIFLQVYHRRLCNLTISDGCLRATSKKFMSKAEAYHNSA